MINEHSLSLCMVVYNQSELLEQAIDSVKSIVDEIVIIDQGSTEEHSKKMKELATIYHKTTNKGNGDYDRQYCYMLANSEFILALDADEIVPKETINYIIELLNSKISFDVLWFLFDNFLKYQDFVVDIKDILGDDPHTRFWRKMTNINGQIVPTLIWANEAHKFPQINTQMQIYSQTKFNHTRQLEDVIKTHLHRGKFIDPNAQQVEKQFIRRILEKFNKDVRENIKVHIPELKDYLRN
jgi:glycosyltransferase involved in cell wall biosynthesis